MTRKAFLSLVLCCAPAFGAVTGVVTNRTSGAPQAGAEVEFVNIGQGGMQVAGTAKTDSKGAFSIDAQPGQASLIRATWQGVNYSRVLAQGEPSTGINLDVYDASRQPGSAKISKHLLMFGPSNGQVMVQETFLISNSGKTTWSDPAGGTVRFYLPSGANGKAEVNATPPGGLPIGASTVNAGKADVFAVQFPVRPGDSRIDITYAVPYTEGAAYEGKIPSQDENTYLIAPPGVTLQGENLNDLGPEPQTQSRIFGLTGAVYKIQLTGSAAPADSAQASGNDGAPQIEPVMPRVYEKAPLILALGIGILAVGFAILYRAPGNSAKETNERGRR